MKKVTKATINKCILKYQNELIKRHNKLKLNICNKINK